MSKPKPKPPKFCYWRGDTLYYRFTVEGQEFRGSLHTTDVKTAAARLKAERERILAAVKYGEHRMLLAAAALRYFEEVAPHKLKPSAMARYHTSWRMIAGLPVGPRKEALQDLHLDQVDNKVLLAIIRERQARGNARTGQPVDNGTINRDLAALAAIFMAAIGWGAIDRNPMRDLERSIFVPEADKPFDMPPWLDIARVVQSAPPMLGRLLHTLYLTGMRLEEAASLTRDRLRLGRAEVQLLDTKNRKPRVVPLSPAAIATLRTAPANLGTPFVFWVGELTRFGKGGAVQKVPVEPDRFSRVSLSANISREIKQAGATFRAHDLRHRFALDWLDANDIRSKPGGIYDLQRIMGHHSVTVTERYRDYSGGIDDSWPFPAPLYALSYDQVLALQLPTANNGDGTKDGTATGATAS